MRQTRRAFYRVTPDASWTGTMPIPTWTNQPLKPVREEWDSILPSGLLHNERNAAGFNSGFPAGMQRPTLLFDKPFGDVRFVDFILGNRGTWIISDAAKDLLHTVDADAFEFIECDARSPTEDPAPLRFWLCDVIRVIDAVDEAASLDMRVIHRADGTKRHYYGLSNKLVLRSAMLRGVKVFNPYFVPGTVFFDGSLVSRWRARKLRGLAFLKCGRED